MSWIKRSQEKSLLGELLLKKKLITREQLAQAIAQQQKTGQRLGDALIELKFVSQRQIDAALRKQRQVRLVAAVIAGLLGPIQAFAAPPAPPVQVTTTAASSSDIHTVQSGTMRALDDEELSAVVGQGGLDNALRAWVEQNQHLFQANVGVPGSLGAVGNLTNQGSGMQGLSTLMGLLNPLMGFLSAQVAMSGVTYDPGSSKTTVNPDGSITLSLPSTIGEISFQNIHVAGNSNGPGWGSIAMNNIDLRGTTITISAGSQMPVIGGH